MIEICAPQSYAHLEGRKVFLAGSIDKGRSTQWRKAILAALAADVADVIFLNPMRDAWDSNWKETIDNPQFREQVEWELQALDDADVVVMYFDPETLAPVTLLELGLQAAIEPSKMIVCCPEGHSRKGNVDIVCARYGIAQATSLDGLIRALQQRVAADPRTKNMLI